MDQAKLGKETQAALREKEDEAKHWKKLYVKATGDGEDDGGKSEADDGDGDGGGAGAGALGVDEVVKLQAQVSPLEILRCLPPGWRCCCVRNVGGAVTGGRRWMLLHGRRNLLGLTAE